MQWQVHEVLKTDSFGRVERLVSAEGASLLRRVACGAALPGSRLVARVLLRRERRALDVLAELPGVPRLVESDAARAAPSLDGTVPDPADVLLREWVAGAPLHRTEVLAQDFFDHLDALVQELHARGVCHNDLHKEQNVLVGADGFPHLIDFQLASRHPAGGRSFRIRVRDDLRHVQKHRRRYTRDGRGPASAGVEHGRGRGLPRSPLARVWRRTGKPVYNFVTRRLLGTSDGEERRPSSGPWPRWVPARGERQPS
jgi:predicted Ser/Thr protein kinase